jgi:hypothetical protein
MGTGQPIFYRIVGQEFEQTLLALTHPPTFHNSSDSFSAGEWVCIARPGTYWGDIGLVWSVSDDEDMDRITVLLVPRITDEVNQATYSNTFVRPPLREELRPHTSDDPPLFTENGEGTWVSGRDRMTKNGMVLKSLAPWELRKNMVDGRDLHLLPLQDAHFRHLLPHKKWSKIPPVCSCCGHVM